MFLQHCLLAIAFILLSTTFGIAQSKKDSVWIVSQNNCKVYNPAPEKNERIIWSGDCKNGFADGVGILVWTKNGKSNQQFEGTLRRGIPQGRGKYVTATSIKEGIFVNGELNGQGVYKLLDEKTREIYYLYSGAILQNKFTGLGVEVYFDDCDTLSIYKGMFKDDDPFGHGTLRKFVSSDERTVFTGNFNGDYPEGNCTIQTFLAGTMISSYAGEFHDEHKEGVGTHVTYQIRYVGQWKNDKKDGSGKLYLDSTLVYDGAWQNDQFNGDGKRYYFDGSTCTGQFKNNKRQGFGVVTWPDGAVYVGRFNNDLYHQEGYIVKNGMLVAAGTWANGELSVTEDFRFIKKRLQQLFGKFLQEHNIALH